MSVEDPGVAHPTESLLDFFVVFSQFEYALKRAGYVRVRPDDQEARQPLVDWERFRLKVKQARGLRPVPGSELDQAVAYLLSHPPKVQRLADDNRTIEWHDLPLSDGDAVLWRLLRIVRAVRNNLFHGGKYPYTRVDEVARATRLLEFSMTVIEQLISCDPEVAASYDDAAQTWSQPADIAG